MFAESERSARREAMWRTLVLLVAILVLVILVAPPALSAQDQPEAQKITVKSKEIISGVVILSVQEGKNSFELQCNRDMMGCTALDPGDYMMVRLPKNRGMYDCANAEVYKKSANSEPGERLGQYCLVGK
jgi:hypothetical protein